MKYFQTDDDGYLIGQFDAEVSPLEPEILDENGDILAAAVYHIPRGGVTVAPPAVGAEQCARLVNGAWTVEPDLRGRVYWLADHSRHEITARGVALPADALPADPPKTQAEIDAEDSEKAKAELLALDLASIRDLRAYVAAKADAPQTLKDRETLAVSTRGRVKTVKP